MWTNLATASVSTKRAPVVDGRSGLPVLHLTGLRATPLVPANADRVGALMQRLKLETSHVLLETFVVGVHDIQHGDMLLVDGAEYVIRDVATWAVNYMLSAPAMHLTVEDLQ